MKNFKWYGGIIIRIESGKAYINRGRIRGKGFDYVPMKEGQYYEGFDVRTYLGDYQVEYPSATLKSGAVKLTKSGGEREFLSVKTGKRYDRLSEAQQA